MKLNIGDKVKFLNDVGGGIVTKIVDENSVLVETDDGFEFPFPTRELVKVADNPDDVFSATKKEDNAKPKTFEQTLEDEGNVIIKDNEEENIYLAFLPEDAARPTQSKQTLCLINDSNWHLLYTYHSGKEHHFSSKPGHLQPNYIEDIKTFNIQELSDIQEIAIQIIFYRTIPYDLKEPLMKRIKIKPERFFDAASFVDNDFFEQKAMMIPLVEKNPLVDAIENLKKKDLKNVAFQKEVKNKKLNEPKRYAKPPKQDLVEVDLHIDALLDDTSGMEAKDMLDYQMNVFMTELKRAQKTHHIKKIVFIHGKGNGRLRNDIRAYLDRNGIKYQDASFQKYGFGATLVFV